MSTPIQTPAPKPVIVRTASSLSYQGVMFGPATLGLDRPLQFFSNSLGAVKDWAVEAVKAFDGLPKNKQAWVCVFENEPKLLLTIEPKPEKRPEGEDSTEGGTDQ